MRFRLLLSVAAVLSGAVTAGAQAPALGPGAKMPPMPVGPTVAGGLVFRDLVSEFSAANVSNASASAVSLGEKAGGQPLPGIFLHPGGADDAKLRFPDILMPPPGPDPAKPASPFLVFDVGLRDGVPWDAKDSAPNGVRFSVAVNDEVVFEEEVRGPGWHSRAVDLSSWTNKMVTVELRTNAIDGNSSYDWALFGRPLILIFPMQGKMEDVPADANGIALAQVECDEASEVKVSVGAAATSASLPGGKHWVPVHFDRPAAATLAVAKGAARLASVAAGAHAPDVKAVELGLSSPLVIQGEPFSVVLKLRNRGLGTYTGGKPWQLAGLRPVKPGPTLGPEADRSIEPERLAPGEEKVLLWKDLVADRPGDWTLPSMEPFHVFPPAPGPAANLPRPEGVQFSVFQPLPPVGAELSTPGWRLSFTGDESGEVYAVAEVWNGSDWQRAGTLYPLARGLARGEGGRQVFLTFHAREIRPEGEGLAVEGDLVGGEAPHPVRVTFRPDYISGRIAMESVLTPSKSLMLLAFYGPNVLAGDRAYGTAKDFAIFPGLEYLEGDEPSSSTRDLAPPLNDRRVPAIHKIATPLAAVQGNGSLMALLWDPKQEWAPGEKYPAARFVAPARDSGFTHIRMSLFAPSVGRYVDENRFYAREPYVPPAGREIKLGSVLVLDHASRYAKESIVQGPHKGGLVLQAMRHYFDTFGLPKPSEPPRSWDDERALCRDAYHHAVWSENPAGWAHCAGWDPLLATGHAVPLLLDLEAGVPDDVRAESQRRIEAVLGRALAEEGPGYFWSNAGCHIALCELPFLHGYTGESLFDARNGARAFLDRREEGLWVWRPANEKLADLGKSGDHTLGQAALPSYLILRAARLSGDRELMQKGLEAMKQMERYEVPRGAQTWECPLYQPDILAAAQAIRAYTEAYRLTGDASHLDHARYWAWTGLPFLYTWEMEGYPTMRYNVISVIGSTHYTHSWIGLPVVWCGLVYAYALQDLAEFDQSFEWKTVAEGITNSAMWQQYTDGPSKGCYPDSWNMEKNKPNPADINPENILLNGFRLRGLSAEPRFARLDGPDGPVFLNAGCDIGNVGGSVRDKQLTVELKGRNGTNSFATLAPVAAPAGIDGAGERAADSAALQAAPSGWLYAPELQAVVMKNAGALQSVTVRW